MIQQSSSSRPPTSSQFLRLRPQVPVSESSCEIKDEYSEAWYELGAPIQLPLLKYLIASFVYLLDNFFLIKNTYNVLKEIGTENINYEKLIIAVAILILHLISSILISVIDSFNKDAISGRKGKYLDFKNHKSVIFLRILAHLTLTMRLFRYTTAYVENRRRNQQLYILRMRRTNISMREIQFVVYQKKNQLVESHYDLVDSFFKTIPAALLQVFFMFQSNPDARLRLYSQLDQDRFALVFITIITASISAANYQFDYLTYKKVLHFQDCFRSGFQHCINLKIAGDLLLICNIPIQILTIGIRICFYSILIFWSPYQFIVTTVIILLINWILRFKWNQTAWRFRPVLENPLYGIPWLCFDLIDLWINLFIPGVHYPKPLDLVLNFYTTLVTGIVIFKGFDFLSPTRTLNSPQFLSNNASSNLSESSNPFQYVFGNNNVNVTNNNEHEKQQDSIYIITTLIRYLVIIHDYLTFNQISYADFFYSVVKYMNIINLICFCYTCLMNALKYYDLDFPIQIVTSFYLPILNSLHASRFAKGGKYDHVKLPFLSKNTSKQETFLIFSMLSNSRFFRNIHSGKWHSILEQDLDKLVSQLVDEGYRDKKENKCWLCIDKFLKAISPVLYPARFREPSFNWDLSTDKLEIMRSLRTHPLREAMILFINDIYDNCSNNRKLLLAVFCANYNDIVRHYTSIRIKKMFEFFDIPIEKGEVYGRFVNCDGRLLKLDCELGYWQRFKREMRGKGKVDSIFP